MIGLPNIELQNAKLNPQYMDVGGILNNVAQKIDKQVAENKQTDKENTQSVLKSLSSIDNVDLMVQKNKEYKAEAINGLTTELSDMLKSESEKKGFSSLFHRPIDAKKQIEMQTKITSLNQKMQALKVIEDQAKQAENMRRIDPSVDDAQTGQLVNKFIENGQLPPQNKYGINPFIVPKAFEPSDAAAKHPINPITGSEISNENGKTYDVNTVQYKASPSQAINGFLGDVSSHIKGGDYVSDTFKNTKDTDSFQVIDQQLSKDEKPMFESKTKADILNEFNQLPQEQQDILNKQAVSINPESNGRELYFSGRINQRTYMRPNISNTERRISDGSANTRIIPTYPITSNLGNEGYYAPQTATQDITVGADSNSQIVYKNEDGSTTRIVQDFDKPNKVKQISVNPNNMSRTLVLSEGKVELPLKTSNGEIQITDAYGTPIERPTSNDSYKYEFTFVGDKNKYSFTEANTKIAKNPALAKQAIFHKINTEGKDLTGSDNEPNIKVPKQVLNNNNLEIVQIAKTPEEFEGWTRISGTQKKFDIPKPEQIEPSKQTKLNVKNITTKEELDALKAEYPGKKEADITRELGKQGVKLNISKEAYSKKDLPVVEVTESQIKEAMKASGYKNRNDYIKAVSKTHKIIVK